MFSDELPTDVGLYMIRKSDGKIKFRVVYRHPETKELRLADNLTETGVAALDQFAKAEYKWQKIPLPDSASAELDENFFPHGYFNKSGS